MPGPALLLRTPKYLEKAKRAVDKIEDVFELIQEMRDAGDEGEEPPGEEPPTDEPGGGDGDGSDDGTGGGGDDGNDDDVSKRILEILKPDGQWLGRPGTSDRVRFVGGGEEGARAKFQEAVSAGGGTIASGTPEGITLARFSNGGKIVLRSAQRSSTGNPTIDLTLPVLEQIMEFKFE